MYDQNEGTPLLGAIPAEHEQSFLNFLRNIGPATLDIARAAMANFCHSATEAHAIALYPHRLALDPARCRNIERSLYNISRCIHTNSRGNDLNDEYLGLINSVRRFSDTEIQIKEYQLYAIRVMKRYGIAEKFTKMVIPATDNVRDPLLPVVLAPTQLTDYQKLVNTMLIEIFKAQRELDTEMDAYFIAAEKGNNAVAQNQCKKILFAALKMLYILFTLLGSGSGFLGGMQVPGLLSEHEVPNGIKYSCGFLGYLCWVFLFASCIDSISGIGTGDVGQGRFNRILIYVYRAFKVIMSGFTALPSALFAGKNMDKIIGMFFSNAPDMVKTMLPLLAQGSNFSINFALNLALVGQMEGLPGTVKAFTRGVRQPLEVVLTGAVLALSVPVGLTGIVPYISNTNVLPNVDLPEMANLLLSIFGDLPSAMLGMLTLLGGNDPFGVLLNPQYRWSGRIMGVFLGVIAPLIFFYFNQQSIKPEDAPLHSLDNKILVVFIQFFSMFGNFIAYSKLGLYSQDIFGAPAMRPLFPPALAAPAAAAAAGIPQAIAPPPVARGNRTPPDSGMGSSADLLRPYVGETRYWLTSGERIPDTMIVGEQFYTLTPITRQSTPLPETPNEYFEVDGRSRSGSQGSDVTQWSNSSSISINRGSRA